MILCEHNCTPCCDFCIYVKHEELLDTDIYGLDWIVKGGPIECNLYNDEEHNKIAENCGYCDDFHCFNANK